MSRRRQAVKRPLIEDPKFHSALVTRLVNTVMTSGLGGNYPPGIPIGRVTEVSGGQEELYPTVKLEPLVRLSTARTVLVLTSFTPRRINLDAP